MAWAYSTTVNATGAASISGSTLTFASAPTGTVAAGQIVTGTGVAANTVISFGSGLSWQVTVSQTVALTAITCSTKILTATGGTQGSPNSFAAGVLAVQTADATAGFQRNRYNQLTNVRVDVAQGAWVRWDDFNTFEFAGSSRYNPIAESVLNANNGGSTIVGTEVLCMVNTSMGYNDYNCLLVNTGGTLITLRSPSGINPLFIQQTSQRNDFPTFPYGIRPAVINIAGMTIRNNGASRKVYFGLARTLTAALNVNFETTSGEYQTGFTTYTGYSAPVASHAGDGASELTNANFYDARWGTEQSGTISFVVTNAGRNTNYLNYNPSFPTSIWNGLYTAAAGFWFTDNRYAATMYSHTPTFKSGSTKLAGVVVQWLGTQTTGTTNYNIANISESLTKNATTTSTGVVSNYLLSAMIGRQAGANPGTSNKYQWSCKARAYGYISADQYVWQNRSFLSDGVNGPLVEDVQLLSVANLLLTQAQAAALTGISLVASGTTGGVITLTSNRTAAEVWAYYRNWISTLANFNSADTWDFDGTTLNIGGWTITGLEYLTSGKVITSTATATAAFTASVTGNVIQNTPTNLTGVNIVGNLTYNTNTPITITLTNSSITGTVTNSGTGLVTINLNNSTIGLVGANVASRLTTSLTISGLTAGSQIYIANETGAQVDYVASSGTSYTLDTTGGTGTWTYKIARYGYTAQSGNHSPALASTTVSISLISDAFITEANKATVAAYTTLENPDKIYDYASYFETTNAGIVISRVISKAATFASAGSYALVLNNTGAIWNLAGGILTLRITNNFVGGSTITGGLLTTGAITLNAQASSAGNYAIINGNSISIFAANYQNITALNSITGFPTTGAISAAGSIDFGNSTIAATGDLSASNTSFTGTLNISTASNRILNLTDCSSSSFTINASGGGSVLVRCLGNTLATAITAGTNVTIIKVAPITAPNLLSGSRVRLYNVTDSVEIYNAVLSSAGFSYDFSWTANKTIKLIATYQNGTTAKLAVEATGVVTSSGLQFLNSQENDAIYNTYAIDGSTVTKFEPDYANDQIDLKIGTNFFVAELYAWWVYNLTTINGIRDFVGGITAEDAANLRINANLVSIKLDNITATIVRQLDNIRIYRSDSAYPVVQPTSGGGGMDVNWQEKVYIATLDSNAIAAILRNTNLIPGLF